MSSDTAHDGVAATEPDARGSVEDAATEPTDDLVDDSTGETPTEGTSSHASRFGKRPFPRWLLFGSAALALAAFIVAAVFGVMLLFTATSDDAELAAARESVRDAAGEAVQAVTEIDYKNPDEFFERSQAASTKDFAKQLSQTEDSLRKALSQVKTRVTTDVNDVAVQQLNVHKGTATFLAVINTHINQGDRSANKVLRLKGKMERVDSGDGREWKLAGLGQVPVVGGGPSGAQSQQGGKQGADKSGQSGSGKNSQQGSGQGSGSDN